MCYTCGMFTSLPRNERVLGEGSITFSPLDDERVWSLAERKENERVHGE